MLLVANAYVVIQISDRKFIFPLFQAERDLRIAQSEFDRQAEITKLLLEGVSSSHAAHLRCLMEFVDAQARYYAQCSTTMSELQKELSRYFCSIIMNVP